MNQNFRRKRIYRPSKILDQRSKRRLKLRIFVVRRSGINVPKLEKQKNFKEGSLSPARDNLRQSVEIDRRILHLGAAGLDDENSGTGLQGQLLTPHRENARLNDLMNQIRSAIESMDIKIFRSRSNYRRRDSNSVALRLNSRNKDLLFNLHGKTPKMLGTAGVTLSAQQVSDQEMPLN